MRASAQCPKCAGTKLYVCENRQPECGSSNIVAFAIATVHSADRDRPEVGSYETWICAACGYTEWYAKDPVGNLEALAAVPSSGVRIVTRASAEPYR